MVAAVGMTEGIEWELTGQRMAFHIRLMVSLLTALNLDRFG